MEQDIKNINTKKTITIEISDLIFKENASTKQLSYLKDLLGKKNPFISWGYTSSPVIIDLMPKMLDKNTCQLLIGTLASGGQVNFVLKGKKPSKTAVKKYYFFA